MTDSVALRGIIVQSGMKYGKIAEKMGITAYTLQKKIDNVVEFKASEIVSLSSILGIDDSTRGAVFFHQNVINNHDKDSNDQK